MSYPHFKFLPLVEHRKHTGRASEMPVSQSYGEEVKIRTIAFDPTRPTRPTACSGTRYIHGTGSEY